MAELGKFLFKKVFILAFFTDGSGDLLNFLIAMALKKVPSLYAFYVWGDLGTNQFSTGLNLTESGIRADSVFLRHNLFVRGQWPKKTWAQRLTTLNVFCF